MKKFESYLLISLYLFAGIASAKDDTLPVKEEEPPSRGLYALQSSQMPGPLFSFGQNVIGKDLFQVYLAPSIQKTTTESYSVFEPSFLYGFSDKASLYFIAPLAMDYRDEDGSSSGVSDATLQWEYAFYGSSTARDYKQATVVAGIRAPTGSYNKTPSTGDGSPSFFLGTTYNNTWVDWLWFASPGVQVATNYHNNLVGTQYLYQLGLGHNLFSVKDKYIFAFLTEFDGLYATKDLLDGEIDPDSGGNTIFVTPSLWFSTPHLILQFGVSLPLVQNLNGEQSNTKYLVIGNVGWTFEL